MLTRVSQQKASPQQTLKKLQWNSAVVNIVLSRQYGLSRIIVDQEKVHNIFQLAIT